MHVQTATDWRKDNGFTHPYTFHPVAAEYLLTSDRLETKLVYDGEEDELVRLRFPSGRQLVGHWGTSLPPGEFRLYAKGPDSEPTPHDIQTTFWSCGESIKMVSGHDGVALEAYSPWDESSYEGPDYELIERWERFLEEGINRSVYLYGEGHGEKLDFCDKAARELGRRIIRLDGGQIEVNELPAWRRVLELISPDVVIVEEATGFLYFRPGTVTYRNTQAFFTQCHESPLTLLCGEEREDGCRLRLRPDVIDEFQKFQGEHSQTEEEQERAPAVREACEWLGWDGFDDLESEFELWRNHDAIRLNAAGGRLVAKSLDLDDVRYRGPHLPLRQAVSEYTSNDMSQQILLRAPVGTGKTTLAFDIACHASDKIIVMDPRATLTMDFERWKKMNHGREPEVVILPTFQPTPNPRSARIYGPSRGPTCRQPSTRPMRSTIGPSRPRKPTGSTKSST